jgi:GNAT superfamily N-acetyltransferase
VETFLRSGHCAEDNPNLQPRLRLATEADLEETFRIYLSSNRDLNQRLGRNVDIESHSLPARAMAVRRNALLYDQERFWVAEFGGTLGGFGLAIRRRSFWYLAALHVLPQFQGRGVGSKLLRRCHGDPGKGNPPQSLLCISEAANIVSTGLYSRFGIFPQSVIIQLQGAPRSLGKAGVTLCQADPRVDQHSFDTMDQLVLGETRPEDHVCWNSVPSLVPYLVHERDQVSGYIYIDRDGALGPAAVKRPDLLLPTISAALTTRDAGHSPVMRIRIPGAARESLAALLSEGFEFDTGINLFLTSRNFGRLDRYLFSGADALF